MPNSDPFDRTTNAARNANAAERRASRVQAEKPKRARKSTAKKSKAKAEDPTPSTDSQE